MACNKAPGEYTVDFGRKSQLANPIYVNQHNTGVDHIGFTGQCTWFAADRVEQLTGVDLATYAGGWGNGGEWWQTAQRFGFPVYDAATALAKRGTLAGYVISFTSAKVGYGTHVAVVESYDEASRSAWVSEMWGSQSWTCEVKLVRYCESELFNSDMHYIDFSSIGMGSNKLTGADVKRILADVRGEKTYDTVDALPFGSDTVQKLVDKGLIKGEGDGLGITYDLLRVLVINDRAGLYDR